MSDDEDYAFYGSAVEPIDEGSVHAKKAPRIEDQTVTDKQGRRRFHGAFTGGFSAGHFNTVGSVEGFTPSTFSSSRTERKKNAVLQTAAMFMDSEDMEAHGIAPQQLQTTSDFALSSDTAKRKRQEHVRGPIPGAPVLLDLVSDTSNNIGVRMLKSLGWKEGQGIGPRLSAKEKKRRRRLMRGKASGDDNTADADNSDSELPDQYSRVTLAPDDADILDAYGLCNVKTNTFGLGYVPLSRDNVLGQRQDWMMGQPLSLGATKDNKKISFSGQAFGVGAFEEEDEDIYAQEDMSHYNFTLGGNRKKSNQQPESPDSVKALTDSLEGFVLGPPLKSVPGLPPLPVLPPNYLAKHKPFRNRFSRKPHEEAGMGRHDLSHEDRRRLLAAPKPSIEVRQGIKSKEQQPAHSSSAASTPLPQTEDAGCSLAETPPEGVPEGGGSSTPQEAGFKPFASDPDKQKRYELYLKMKEKGMRKHFAETLPSHLTEWEKKREEREFERAAQLYRPLSFTMATRFVSSSTEGGEPLLKEGLNLTFKKTSLPLTAVKNELTEEASPLPDPPNGVASPQEPKPLSPSPASSDPSPSPVSSDPRVNAARASMFGSLTLSEVEWHPENVLCRRFNVPNPFPDSNSVGVVSRKSRAGGANIFSGLLSATPTLSDPKLLGSSRGKSSREPENPSETASEITDSDSKQFNLNVPVDGPPTMDLFKAIFADSSSDSPSDPEEEIPSNSMENNNNNKAAEKELEKPKETNKDKEFTSQKKVRKSRFEPIKEEETGEKSLLVMAADEPTPKHLFRSKKNSSSNSSILSKNRKKKKSVIKSSLSFAVDSDSSDSDGVNICSSYRKKVHSYLSSLKNTSHTAVGTNLVNNKESSNFSSSVEVKPEIEELPSEPENFNKVSSEPENFNKVSSEPEKFNKVSLEPDNFNKVSSEPENFNKVSSEPENFTEEPKDHSHLKKKSKTASGIFSNIDFAELNCYRELMNEKKNTKEVGNKYNRDKKDSRTPEESEEYDSEASTDSEDKFGPALPPNFTNPLQEIMRKKEKTTKKVNEKDAEWKEVTKTRKKEKKNRHKSKSKRKHKISKKEKKKRSKKSRKESSSSEESSD